MTTKYKVKVKVKKTRSVTIRKDESRPARPWDWYYGDDVESREYFESFEEAYEDARKQFSS